MDKITLTLNFVHPKSPQFTPQGQLNIYINVKELPWDRMPLGFEDTKHRAADFAQKLKNF